jgi:hypothetical protein
MLVRASVNLNRFSISLHKTLPRYQNLDITKGSRATPELYILPAHTLTRFHVNHTLLAYEILPSDLVTSIRFLLICNCISV